MPPARSRISRSPAGRHPSKGAPMPQRSPRQPGLYPRAAGILTAAILASMTFAGLWLTRYLRNVEIRPASEMAQGYSELAASPILDAAPLAVRLAWQPGELEGIAIPLGRVETILIWHPGGTILCSAGPSTGLGLRGICRRIAPLGGRFRLRHRRAGTLLAARLRPDTKRRRPLLQPRARRPPAPAPRPALRSRR